MKTNITTVKRNWNNIKRSMTLSMSTPYGWEKYSQIISNGLSNNVINNSGNGNIIYFVEKMPSFSHCDEKYLKYACKLSEDEIIFISQNREFLKSIN